MTIERAGTSWRFFRSKRRRWTIVVSSVGAAGVLTVLFLASLQPTPPFHPLWSTSLPGNPFGDGARVGPFFVTYQTNVHPATPGSNVSMVTYSLEAIDLANGTVAWSTTVPPIDTSQVYWAKLLVEGTNTVLVITSGFLLINSTLTSILVNGLSGKVLGDWSLPLSVWADSPPQTEVALGGPNLVVWYPVVLSLSPTPTTTLEVLGAALTTGRIEWNATFSAPGGGGWGTGTAWGYGDGETVLMTLVTGPPGSDGVAIGLNATNGKVLFNRTTPPSVLNGVVERGVYYFLSGSNATLSIVGINMTSGANATPRRVTNVADNESSSAELYGAGSTLVVASYSPSLNFAAYASNGSRLWELSFPPGSSCGPQPDYPVLGPCASLLFFVPMGNGSALLESSPSLMRTGYSYVETYRLVDLSTGAQSWSFSYSFVFGQKLWPWQGPEPGYTIQQGFQTQVIYTVVMAETTETGSGTT